MPRAKRSRPDPCLTGERSAPLPEKGAGPTRIPNTPNTSDTQGIFLSKNGDLRQKLRKIRHNPLAPPKRRVYTFSTWTETLSDPHNWKPTSMTSRTAINTAHVVAATANAHVAIVIAATAKPCMVRGNGRQIDPGTDRSSMR